jgi:hypothetical protein
MVLTESRSLAGALRKTCNDYAVHLAATNGQVGGFLHTDIIPVLREGTRVLYFGDWDIAGHHIEANTRNVLEEVGVLRWERLALTTEQVKRYKLPAKIKTDKRYTRGGGVHKAVETEALSQGLIVRILRQRLDKLLPKPLTTVLGREKRQRSVLWKLLQSERRST